MKIFEEKMIAPCGLDCSLCSLAHDHTHPCPGCNGPNENKPTFCSESCGIIQCSIRKNNQYQFCDECPQFPCETIMERENRYKNEYPLVESPLQNLHDIRELGMEAFLKKEKENYSCSYCGGVVSVHTGICSECEKIKK